MIMMSNNRDFSKYVSLLRETSQTQYFSLTVKSIILRICYILFQSIGTYNAYDRY